jgi:hypothetical protein
MIRLVASPTSIPASNVVAVFENLTGSVAADVSALTAIPS